MNPRTIVVLCIAVAAGAVAAFLVASMGAPHGARSDDADSYCYRLKTASVCTLTRAECETRLARENASDVQRRCTPHEEVPLTP